MIDLTDQIKSQPMIYVTRDIERAIGILPKDGYFVISNWSEYAEEIASLCPSSNIFLIKENELLDTWELLEKQTAKDFINKISKTPKILVFKNTKKIEKICKDNKWNLINPNAELADKIENKISQIDWLSDLAKYLPEHEIKATKEIEWKNKPFVLQWGQGHTGDSSILINSKEQLEEIKSTFGERTAKITEYITGPVFTSNIIISKNKILFGNISYQITGALPFTEKIFSTIGNDWGLPFSELTKEKLAEYNGIASEIAEKMKVSGWLGLFGIDIIFDTLRNKLFLIEINARQPASTTFESELQKLVREETSEEKLTIFEAHILALLEEKIEKNLIEINDGAQIIQRITKKISQNSSLREAKNTIINESFKVIEYRNTKLNADLLRIQSHLSIMESHNKFNKRGQIILDSLIAVL